MRSTEFTIAPPYKSNRLSWGRWLTSHIIQHKMLLLVMCIGAFGNASMASAVPVFMGIAFDAVLETPVQISRISWAAVGIILSQLIRAVLQFGRNFSSEVIGQRLERDIRQELYINLLGKSMTFHDMQPVGDTMARATNDVREINRFVNPGINLVIGSANFIILPIILAATYHPQLIFAPLFFLVTFIIALIRYLHVLAPVADRVRTTFGTANSRLAEAIDGVEMVKGVAQETQETGRFHTLVNAYRDAVIARGHIEARFPPLLLLGLANAIGFTHAIMLYNDGLLDIGDIVAYMGMLSLLGFPAFVALLAYSQVAQGMAGARRIFTLLQMETHVDENPKGYTATMRGDITFDNVDFAYIHGKNVLRQITFTIPEGQTVAIVGQTGAGKSTIAKLINRTYDVQNGRISIDGQDVRAWNLNTLRQQISIIEQDIFLFSRSIAENIAFGNPTATPKMIENAARAAQAHNFIMRFKDGYNTVIGDRGVTLSGGQRQRIAIARAFLTNPRILVLDDSTSAIDSATEDRIQMAITRIAERQTTILITHRLSQIRWADQVLLLRNGKLIAAGNHEDLMESTPGYRQIFTNISK